MQVRGLYDELWDRPPPERGRREKGAASRTRNHARKQGWPPPAAWDDENIDNPDAGPAPGWERPGRREWGAVTEEATELAGQGVNVEMIAVRLGVTRKTVERTLLRAERKAA
jgi:hypothetical protein